MPIELRPRQLDLIQKTGHSFRTGHRRPLLYAPCGFGKTICFCYFCSKIIESGKRVVLLAHREELVEQISKTLLDFGVDHGFICAGLPFDHRPLVHVASVFTLIRRLQSIEPPDYIIVDESQHCCKNSTWHKIIAAFPEARVIGVSGSPIRLGGEPLGDVFDDLVLGPSTYDLIQEKWLSPYRLFAPANIDRSGLHTQAGDFIKAETSELMDKPGIIGDAVSEWKKYGLNRQTAVFCVSVEHAYHVAEQYRTAGVNAVAIDGGMDRHLRRQIIHSYRDGSLQLVAACDLINEGVDIGNISLGQFLRPTASLSLHIQQIGRCIRSHPGKDYAILLDHVGNTRVHGPIDQEFSWSLTSDGTVKKKRKKEEDKAKIRTCPKCKECWGLEVRVCRCGVVLVQSREIEQHDGELQEIDPATLRRQRMFDQMKADTYEKLVAFGRAKNFRFPEAYAKHVMRARQEKAAAKQRQAPPMPPPEAQQQEIDPQWLF